MDQPPPVPPPTPPPAPVPAVRPPPPQKDSSCARGCLVIGLALLLLAGLIIGGTWYLYGRALNLYTSTSAARVKVATPSPSEIRSAQATLASLREAISINEARRIELTGTDINALIANEQSFSGARGRVFVTIQDSEIVIESSIPLSAVPLPKIKDRWLNSTAHVVFGYDGDFHFEFKSGAAQGVDVPVSFFRSFNRSFTQTFNDKFKEEVAKQGSGSFWNHIEQISIESDKLVIVTKSA